MTTWTEQFEHRLKVEAADSLVTLNKRLRAMMVREASPCGISPERPGRKNMPLSELIRIAKEHGAILPPSVTVADIFPDASVNDIELR